MTFIVKTKSDTLPAAVRQQAGIKIGDMLEFKVSGSVVTVIPKLPPPTTNTPRSNEPSLMPSWPKAWRTSAKAAFPPNLILSMRCWLR